LREAAAALLRAAELVEALGLQEEVYLPRPTVHIYLSRPKPWPVILDAARKARDSGATVDTRYVGRDPDALSGYEAEFGGCAVYFYAHALKMPVFTLETLDLPAQP
jgi:hypothetical protein